MPSYIPGPMTYDAAGEWLRSRVNVPTDMSSAELALAPEFDARVRTHSFFSARVAAADALESVREFTEAYAAGEMNRATARWRIKTALTRQGYAADDVGMTDEPPAGMSEDEWRRRRAITNLASTRRIDLILNQNARMGWAVGRKHVGAHPAVKRRWPYWRYIARDDSRTRPAHAALDNMVLPKDDPFWHTHTPPWEFGCRCDIEDADEDEAEQYGRGRAVTEENPDGSQHARIVNPATGAAQEIMPPQSGFVFRSDEPFSEFDMGRIRNLDLRRATHGAMLREAARSGSGLTLRGAEAMARGQLGVRSPDNVAEIRGAFAAVYDALQSGRELPELRVPLGRVLREHADRLGIDPEETAMWLVSPGTAHYGPEHARKRHAADLAPDRAMNLLERTIWHSAAHVSEVFTPSNRNVPRRLVFHEDNGPAMTTMWRHGAGWEFNLVDSWEEGEDHRRRTSPRRRGT